MATGRAGAARRDRHRIRLASGVLWERLTTTSEPGDRIPARDLRGRRRLEPRGRLPAARRARMGLRPERPAPGADRVRGVRPGAGRRDLDQLVRSRTAWRRSATSRSPRSGSCWGAASSTLRRSSTSTACSRPRPRPRPADTCDLADMGRRRSSPTAAAVSPGSRSVDQAILMITNGFSSGCSPRLADPDAARRSSLLPLIAADEPQALGAGGLEVEAVDLAVVGRTCRSASSGRRSGVILSPRSSSRRLERSWARSRRSGP